MLDPHKRVARSWYTLGSTNDNTSSWLGAFCTNFDLWSLKMVFQNTTIFPLQLYRRRFHIKAIHYISPNNAKIKHRTMPNLSSLVQGQAVFEFYMWGTALLFIFCVGRLEKFIRALQLWKGYECSDTICTASTAMALL